MKYRKKKSYWQQVIRRREYLKALLFGSGILVLIAYLFYESLWVTFLMFPSLFLWIRLWESHLAKKKKLQFELQFKDALQAVSAALQVGYAVENAWREAGKEMNIMHGKDALVSKEFQYMVRQLEMNLTLETVLDAFAERTGDEEVEIFVVIFSMAKRSGGNMIEIIRTATTRIADKVEMKREMETVISAKKTEFYIMSIIPLAMVCYMKLSFGDFISVLYGTVTGRIVMTICLGIYVVAFLIGRKMVEIEV